MAKYAYKDENKTQEITAEEARVSGGGGVYFCPGKDCTARLSLVRKNGLSSVFFRSLKTFPHIPCCEFSSDGSYNIEDYETDSFDIDEFEKNLYMDSTAKSPSTPKKTHSDSENPAKNAKYKQHIRTIRQLYNIFKGMGLDDHINDISRKEILCDDKSKFLYTKYLSGFKLIECKFSRYDNDKLILKVFYQGGNDAKFFIDLAFDNKDLYYKAKNDVFNNRENVIVVGGEVEHYPLSKKYAIEIHSLGQIYFPR